VVWDLPMGGNLRLEVHDGQVVNVSNDTCEHECDLADYQKVTVDWFFDSAYLCRYFCRVEFHPTYGYPIRIRKGFLESGWLEITLEPITSTKSNADH
jgi:hypothetical protein